MQTSALYPRVVVTSAATYWSVRDVNEARVGEDQFAQLKDSLGDQVEVGATVFNESILSKIKRKALGVAQGLPATLAISAGLSAIAVAAGALTLPAALGVAALGAAGWSTAGLAGSLSSELKNPYPVGITAQHTSDTPIQLSGLGWHSSSGQAFGAMGVHNLKAYPHSLHIAHFNGHGHGAKLVAGLSGQSQKAALDGVVREATRGFDIGYFETCYGSNFELLHAQADGIDYAVSFQDQIPKSNAKHGRLPLARILGQAAATSTPREAAVAMARAAGEVFDSVPAPIAGVPLAQRLDSGNWQLLWENTDSTTVAVDLKTLRDNLSPSLDRVGVELQGLLRETPELADRLAKAREENRVDERNDQVDLGGFLSSVREAISSETASQALNHALEALESSILYKRTGSQIPLSGLSFHSRPRISSPGRFESAGDWHPNLPVEWQKLVSQLET